MAELASDKSDPKPDVERVDHNAWAGSVGLDQPFANRVAQNNYEQQSVALPTLHLNDDKLNVTDNYNVNSDIAQLYIKNRPAIVRINTMDPKADASFSTSAGSGSIIDSTGIIATGYHVVKNATALRVKTSDGKVYEATILDADSAKDQALIKIKSDNPFAVFPTVSLASDTSAVKVGTDVVALGFPKNQDQMHLSKLSTEARMPLSAVNVRGGLFMGEDRNRDLIKTVGQVFSGNSGGPAFDLTTGKQIGIVNMSDAAPANPNAQKPAEATRTYITPVEDLQNFLAKTKAKYGINTLPGSYPVDRSSYPSSIPLSNPYSSSPFGSGLQNLDKVLHR